MRVNDHGSRVAVIPARGGSKRIPRKNIRLFAGKPMIAWSIEAALSSNCFDRIIVSTEDDEIAEVARAWGAETPFRRPVWLADDDTGTIPVIAHAITWLQQQGDTPDIVCCLYATAPFLRPADVVKGLEALEDDTVDYAFTVTRYAFPIQRALKLTREVRVEMFQPEQFNTRSQDLEEAWHDAGQLYWGRRKAWVEGSPIFSTRSVPIVLPRYRVQDIDTEEDWRYAELMQETLFRKKGAQ